MRKEMTSQLSPHQTVNLDLIQKMIINFLNGESLGFDINKKDVRLMKHMVKEYWSNTILDYQISIYNQQLELVLMRPISNYLSDPHVIKDRFLQTGKLRMVLSGDTSKCSDFDGLIQEDGKYYLPIDTITDLYHLQIFVTKFPEIGTYLNLKLDSDLNLDINWKETITEKLEYLNSVLKNSQERTLDGFLNRVFIVPIKKK